MGIAVRVAGLTLETCMFDRPARWLRPLATTCLFGIVLFAQPGGERLALGVGYAGTGAANSGLDHVVPMFPAALDGVRQGFVRIVNHSPRAGEVQVEAYDDDGTRFGPVTLDIDADATVHFNSGDLEDGNAAKGLAVGTGPGVGEWWLALSSDLDIEVLSYIRTPGDGFLTSMHDVVPPDADGDYRVAIFNPGSNADQVSRLRLVNAGEQTAEVTITGVDDRGASPGGDVRVSVPAGAARTLAADQLESGAGLQGALGDGTGKWALRVASDTPVLVMSLLQSPTGHLTNLSTAPDNVDAGTRTVPLFPAASDPFGRQGFVRVINRSTEAGDVTVAAFDDTDRDFGSVTLSLDANATAHFNSDDLEVGNAAKGLSGSTGAGAGDWRLELSSDLDIEVLAYIRTTSDGFLTAMHDTVPREGDRHRVAIFNPGSNADQVSRLRLVNAGNDPAEVTVAGIDDRGASSSGGSVAVSVPAGTSRTLTAHELEAGADGFDGELGNGAGKWQLVVESGQPVIVMSLLSSPTGHLTNLSTAPAANFAPAEAAAFDDRVVGKRIVGANPANHVDFLADGRFRETEGADTYEGGYTYGRTGTHAATVVFRYDDGETCTYELTFASRTAGSLSFTCDEGAAGESSWHLVELSGGEMKTYGTGETIDTLPTGSWSFDRLGGSVGFRTVGGEPDIQFGEGGYLERGSYRYTCESAAGCRVRGREVTAGRIVQTPLGGSGDEAPEGPDLVVESPSASAIAVQPGASFTLTATVRNRGNERAAATTLRYFRSSNATISTGDTEVGSVAADALDASTASERSTDVTAPAVFATYYYGACADVVDGESDTGNNCSAAVAVTVSARTATCAVDLDRSSGAGGTEGVEFALAAARQAQVGEDFSWIHTQLVKASDFHVYEFALTAGRLAVFTQSELDMQAVFLGDDCTEVDAVQIVEDIALLPGEHYENFDFRLAGDLDPGTYYLVVFEWSGRTGDYSLGMEFDDPLVNGFPAITWNIPDQEIAPGDTATAFVHVVDDRGDTHTFSVESDDENVVTVSVTETATVDPGGWVGPGERSTAVLHFVAGTEGTAGVRVRVADQHEDKIYSIGFTVAVTSPSLSAPTVETGSAAGELTVAFTATFDPMETRAYEYEVRRKRPQTPWARVCHRFTSNSDSVVTVPAGVTFSGLRAGVSHEVRYRDRGSSSCYDGTPGGWSAVGEGATRAQPRAFELDADNRDPAGIVATNGLLYVLDDVDDRIFAYTTTGGRDAASDFDLDADNGQPEGIARANGKLYVADDADGKIYAYLMSGERDAAADLDLHTDNGTPWGLTYVDERFYVVDGTDDSVYAYRLSGARDAVADFDLDADNSVPGGIAYAGGRFFVADWSDAQVYAYLASGERDENFDFDLDADNRRPDGVAYAAGSFYVVDDATDRIFVYAEDGGAAAARLSFPEGIATNRAIPENIPAGIHVGGPVSADGDEGLVYSLDGPDAGSFDLLPATGQIRTKDGVAYDYETQDRYVVEVGAADDDGNRASIDVTIRIIDLVPSCGSQDELNLRTNHGDGRLTLRWDPLAALAGHAPVQGYETEIRRGDTAAWSDRRAFLGRNITGAVYGDLDNEVGYQVRVRPINAEGDCEWSTPVSGIPTADRAPRDDEEYHDRFGPHPVGTPDRNLRLLTPGRCRHTLDGVRLDADCTYERTGPHAGRISLEFDDPSRGSCDVVLAYSSLTAGSFVDECFDAGVNTEVAFDRSFRMPPLSDRDAEDEVPRAPRSQEEFDVLAWGRDDFIPGLGFGCAPVFDNCEFAPGRGYTFGRDADTGRPLYVEGEYTYMNTGPSTGVLTFRDDLGSSYTFTLDFGGSGGMRATIEAPGGDASVWPGMPHLDLTLGTQPVLLPIPPFVSAAIAIETDVAATDWDGLEDRIPTPGNPAYPISPRDNLLGRTLFGALANAAFGDGIHGDGLRLLGHGFQYRKTGHNRAVVTFGFWDYLERFPDTYRNFGELQQALSGSTWVFDLTFTSERAARYTLTVTKEGHLPTAVEGVVDFHGDGISVDEFPEELLLPEDAPQASGEDVSGVEVAPAITVSRLGADDLQTFLVSAAGADYQPGDWLEPKDGGNQRMMIVGAGQGASVSTFEALGPHHVRDDRQAFPARISIADQPGDGLEGTDGANQPITIAGVGARSSVSDTITDVSPGHYGNLQKTRTALSPGPSSALAAAVALHSSTDGRVAASSSAFIQLMVVCMQRDGSRYAIPWRGARYFSRAKAAEGEGQSCQKDCVLNEDSNIQSCAWECEAGIEGD